LLADPFGVRSAYAAASSSSALLRLPRALRRHAIPIPSALLSAFCTPKSGATNSIEEDSSIAPLTPPEPLPLLFRITDGEGVESLRTLYSPLLL